LITRQPTTYIAAAEKYYLQQMKTELELILRRHKPTYHPVIKTGKENGKLLPFNFTKTNTEITEELIADTGNFSRYISSKLADANATFGIGGYNENRTLYKRSKLFTGSGERSLHLGVDIWGPAGTKVYAPLGGMVHSFAFNNNFGDYGATIILQHNLETTAFYTLYGHLSLADLTNMRVGKFITRGEVIGHFGPPEENGSWPPHLHFQIIQDIGFYEGDYPGVCDPAAAIKFLRNSPDPDLMLNF
jgi:murein DD-endopeptidase MepM/ murein hydrolase activator NlpD